jgi:hypothetical protein
MSSTEWYELRVTGSAGTRASAASGIQEGIAMAENGRLCAVSSGHARRFTSQQEAIEFLGSTTLPGVYDFEAVRCRSDRDAA